jgi:hypothetical protein
MFHSLAEIGKLIGSRTRIGLGGDNHHPRRRRPGSDNHGDARLDLRGSLGHIDRTQPWMTDRAPTPQARDTARPARGSHDFLPRRDFGGRR